MSKNKSKSSDNKSSAAADSKAARLKERRERNAALNAQRAAKNLALVEELNIEPEETQRTVRRTTARGSKTITEFITVVKPKRPSKLLRKHRRSEDAGVFARREAFLKAEALRQASESQARKAKRRARG